MSSKHNFCTSKLKISVFLKKLVRKQSKTWTGKKRFMVLKSNIRPPFSMYKEFQKIQNKKTIHFLKWSNYLNGLITIGNT